LLIAFFLAVQIAALVDMIERGARVIALIAVAITGALYLAMLRFPFPTPAERSGAVLALLPSVVVLLAVTAAIILARRWVMFIVFAVVIAEVWTVTWPWNPVLPASAMYPPTPLIRALVKLHEQDPPSAFRMTGYGAVLFPNLATMYG